MAMPSNVDRTVSPPRITIPRDYNAAADLIDRNLHAGRAAKVAYHDDHASHTYGELAERVNRVANALVALGLQMEQRVLLCLHDTIDFPACFLGSIKAGVVPIAANTLLTTADYGYMLHDSRALVLIVSESLLPTFTTLLGTSPFLKHVIVSGADAQGHLLLSLARASRSSFRTREDDLRRRVLLALFIGFHGRTEGHRSCPFELDPDRRVIRTADSRHPRE